MSLQDKCIITAALAGAATMKSQNPAVPYTVDEFVEEAYNCYNAGCAIVHIHARDPETGLPTASLDTLGAIVRGITEKCPIVINLSSAIGLGATPEERISVVKKFKPENEKKLRKEVREATRGVMDKPAEFEPHYCELPTEFDEFYRAKFEGFIFKEKES